MTHVLVLSTKVRRNERLKWAVTCAAILNQWFIYDYPQEEADRKCDPCVYVTTNWRKNPSTYEYQSCYKIVLTTLQPNKQTNTHTHNTHKHITYLPFVTTMLSYLPPTHPNLPLCDPNLGIRRFPISLFTLRALKPLTVTGDPRFHHIRIGNLCRMYMLGPFWG